MTWWGWALLGWGVVALPAAVLVGQMIRSQNKDGPSTGRRDRQRERARERDGAAGAPAGDPVRMTVQVGGSAPDTRPASRRGRAVPARAPAPAWWRCGRR